MTIQKMKTPTIDDARRLAQRDGLLRCVVLFQLSGGRVGYASYGRIRQLCDSTASIIDRVFETVAIDMEANLGTCNR